MKQSLICLQFLLIGITLHAQMPYTINPYAGDLQNTNTTLVAASGNIVAGELTGTNLRLVHILFSFENTPITGLDNSMVNSEINVYPNPFNVDLFIDTGKIIPDQLMIYNSKGEKVYDMAYTSPEIQLTEIMSGVYLLIILDKSKRVVGSYKILKL